MAKSTSEWYNILIAEKETMPSLTGLLPSGSLNPVQTLLADLQSVSRVARWRLVLWVVAYACFLVESITELMIANQIANTLPRRKQISLEFQYGDAVVVQNGQYIYSPVNTANRIIAFCSVSQDAATRQVIIKVGKDDGAGNPTPLSTPELDAFTAYTIGTGTEGTAYTIRSSNPDIFKIGYTVYYNPQLMSATGELLDPDFAGVYPVEDAINNYLKVATPDEFDNVFVGERLDQLVNAATGVSYAECTVCQAKYGLLPYTNILASTPRTYISNAGYGVVSTTPGESLSDLITYVADPAYTS